MPRSPVSRRARAARRRAAVVGIGLALGLGGAELRGQTRVAPADPGWGAHGWGVHDAAIASGSGVRARIGGQWRGRVEAWEGFGFGGPGPRDDVFFLSRLRLQLELKMSRFIGAYVEAKSSLATERELPGGRRPADVDQLDIQNLYLELRFPLGRQARLRVRPGRQELLFGSQRLVSPLDWSNTRRTFEGATVELESAGWTATGFWAYPVPVRKYDANERDADTRFFGAYVVRKWTNVGPTVDLYWLGLDRARADETRHTIGARADGRLDRHRFAFEFEVAYQVGAIGDADIRAFMLAARLAHAVRLPPLRRVHVGFDYATGDGDPDDDRVGTFDQLFPLGHAYLGYVDVVGRQNVLGLSAGAELRPAARATLAVTGHRFWRDQSTDALYNPGSGVVRPGDAGMSRSVGSELDATLAVRLGAARKVVVGYSHFFPGAFIEESGPSRAIDFAYAILQVEF